MEYGDRESLAGQLLTSWAAGDEFGMVLTVQSRRPDAKHTAKSRFWGKAEEVDQLVRRDSGGNFLRRSLERRLRVAEWEMLWKRRICK